MNTGNINKFIRFLAIVLLLSIVLSMASCYSEKAIVKTEKISADAPWYNAEIIDFEFDADTNKRLSRLNHSMAGIDDKFVAIISDGAYHVKAWTDDVEYNDWLIKVVTIIDRTTKQTVKTIDIVDILGKWAYPTNVNYIDGKLWVYADTYNPDTSISMNIEYEIDPVTEIVLNTKEINNSEDDTANWILDSYNVWRYKILPEQAITDTGSYYVLRIIEPDGTIAEVEVKDPDENIYEIPTIFPLNETTVLIPAAMDRDYNFYKLDLETNELSKADNGEYSWLDVDQLADSYNSPNGSIYTKTQNGISRIDLENKKLETVLDFDSCAVNRNYTTRLKIVDCNNDNILLCGSYESTNMFKSLFVQDFVIVELTKAAKNPHAGKTILELYVHEGGIDGTIADAIIKYNENNSKYYIQPTNRYNKWDYMSYDNLRSNDDYATADLKASADLSYELASDIANGVGPDIILNASSLGQLNNDNCLLDLSPYLQDLDSDKYYENIIDGARIDGKLYQLPVCYTIEGIQTDPALAGKTGIGFTPDEYKTFLDETLNGKDIIEDGQTHYFALLFNNMMNTFIKEGKADLTVPEFTELAGFVKENVQPNSKMWDYNDEEEVDPEVLFNSSLAATTNKAYYCNCPGISGYLVKRARVKNGTTILGLPSADGRGPMFGTKLSVAVSATALNKEACIDFVRMMLTDEIQTEFVLSDHFVLNRSALRQGLNEAIKYYNSEEGQDDIYEYSLGTYVSISTKFTDEDIANMENIILSCSKADSVDAAINMILIEEMPAYFAGQKKLDQVIPIMQDRIQKVLDERK